jgi:hypothetical protein
MNIYILYEGQPNWYTANGFLSNGFFFGQHLCSHPCFMKGDLYLDRTNRIDALKKMFNVYPNNVEFVMIEVKRKEDIPGFIQNAPLFDDEYRRYETLVGRHTPEIKIEVSE